MLESIIDELIAQRISPIYLDEVGVLEINGGGYHNILKKLLSSGLDLVITVRDDLVKPVASHFDIKTMNSFSSRRGVKPCTIMQS
jgi:nucleoside-triphosphatase THEP1